MNGEDIYIRTLDGGVVRALLCGPFFDRVRGEITRVVLLPDMRHFLLSDVVVVPDERDPDPGPEAA